MKKIIFICFAVLLFSCGKSEKQVHEEKKRQDDSISKLVENAKKQAIEDEKRKVDEEKDRKRIEYENSPEGKRQSIFVEEAKNPQKYLKFNFTHENPIFGRSLLKVSFDNKAIMTNYEEILFEIKYLTKENNLVKKWNKTIHGPILANTQRYSEIPCLEYGSDVVKFDMKLIHAKASKNIR